MRATLYHHSGTDQAKIHSHSPLTRAAFAAVGCHQYERRGNTQPRPKRGDTASPALRQPAPAGAGGPDARADRRRRLGPGPQLPRVGLA
ncbi:hypothetical protein FMEAI12_6500066 [Parafrankia sp. Ea1.12]|nr:hypothetical protein FMEAI12_6500066 [Parafrankia sp. Ea1.12]